MYGVCLKSVGQLDVGAGAVHQDAGTGAAALGVYANLADLDKFTPDNPQLKAMEKIFAEAPDPASDRYLPAAFRHRQGL